eukprot:TRINITY_DN11104_c0_g1_i1.p1 TRINITY_DN11104_c0_g1~~TRINITY_DN11104_c0_g1_i1.p1  ORF type:complete len:198 (-),score=51.31 TRINITY_DN11104_c0_g1_i1:34-627(-)
MALPGTKAKRLLQELRQGDWMPPFNEDGVRAILQEIQALDQEISDTLASSRQGEELPIQVKIGMAVHHAGLTHNRRCLLAYVRYRAAKASALRWDTGPVVPDSLAPNLSAAEQDFFNKYDRLLTDYQQDFGLDLTADARPPRELYVEVRSLTDDMDVFTDSGLVRLKKGARYLLRHTDVEHLVRQGMLEQIQSAATT